MELRNEISLDLWNKISKHYDEGNYTDCIIDAMLFLTDIIRDKSGLTIDGEKLVQKAFINKEHKIHITPARTQTEKDIQRGYGDIIKGMYTAIRNPRHHDFQTDKKEDTDIIIVFIELILKKINDSSGAFDEDKLFILITEKLFVKNHEYAQSIVDDIPKGKRLNVAIKIVLTRNKDNEVNYEWIMYHLLEELEQEEIEQLYQVVSAELETETKFRKISTIFKVMKPIFWPYTKKSTRMRIENYIYEDAKAGTLDTVKDSCGDSGALATWAYTYLTYFENKSKWTNMLINKMISSNKEEIDYVVEFYWAVLFEWNKEDIVPRMKWFISKQLKEKDEFILNYFAENVYVFEDHPWNLIFILEIKEVESELEECLGNII